MRSAGGSWLLLAGFVLFYFIYLLLGALLFSSIERPAEELLRRDVDALKRDFLNRSCVTAAALERFLLRVLAAEGRGGSAAANASAADSNWDLVSSMFFANTLVTTVGYGHTTPLSDTGKAFSVLYALIGVPFTMLVLTACVQRLMYPLVAAPVGLLQRSGMEPRAATAVHFLLLLLLVVLCFFVAPAAIFSAVEGSWSFLDGFYFSFISLCTIGLGDLVPGTQPGQRLRPLYQVAVMVYLFLGLMMMYLLLRTFHKMADLHGLTTLLHLPRCEESDMDEDREPIVDGERPRRVSPPAKASSEHLAPAAQPSYNTISKG